ncbi:MAG: HAMP domain-containing histidine kinase [Ruminococcaceae bacterium]|nr:HAMP domain-containing histidine kinase [Oscillospiraceae bacterium]
MKDILLIISLVLALVVCVLLLALHVKNKKKIRTLTESIDTFLKDGEQTALATDEGDFAHLQNNICELETRLLYAHEYTKREARNNTEFIADISHQLKTPLAGLRLYCEMKHNAAPDSYTEKELALISKMEKLIHNVLKLEKIRSDTYIMNFAETQISTVFNELQAEFGALFPQKTITVHGDAALRCDKAWLREAFGNVIKNACEHTAPDGRVDILIEEAEKSVSITIEDNGGGVKPDDLAMLFRRFHRSQNASPDSAGIGLAVTRAIVEKHHGTVTAENRNKGLCVSMCFPVIDANLKL